MILFYNSKLECVSSQNEVSFSYSKKAGKEGSGKVEVLNAPPHDAIYIILLDGIQNNSNDTKNIEYIASGYIDSFNSQKNNTIQLTFKTFEGILENFRLPRYWHKYENWKLKTAITDLLFQTISNYYTSRAELFYIETKKDNNVIIEDTKHILYDENIAYENIEKADLTLAFDATKQKEENVYYYCTHGRIIYLLDFGDDKRQVYYKRNYNIKTDDIPIEENEVLIDNNNKKNLWIYPTRILRYSGQEGAKTFLYWRALESDVELTKINEDNPNPEWLEALNEKPLLYFRKDDKDYSERCGVALPSKCRYVALELMMRYKNPDYNNDFNTCEINKSTDNKKDIVKRTVRGFTPILHGFEIIKRGAINPFENAQVEVSFSDIETTKINNLPLENMSLLDAIQKLEETYKFDVAFDLRLMSMEPPLHNITPTFFISIFRRDELGSATYYGLDRRWDDCSLLRENKHVITHNNFNIKEQKKSLTPPYVLFVEGAGNPFDALHLTFLITYVFIEGKEKHQIQLVNHVSISFDNNLLGNIPIIDELPSIPLLKEERVEFKDASDIGSLFKKAIEHINSKEKKDNVFEVDIYNPTRLYDKVRVLSESNKKVYDALILEEKISKKNNKLNKSVALDSTFFNPFDIFFKSKVINPLVLYPAIPISLEITSHKNILNISWDVLSVYDDFTIKIKRCDKKHVLGFEYERAESEISVFTEGDVWSFKDDPKESDLYFPPSINFPQLPIDPPPPPPPPPNDPPNDPPDDPTKPVEPTDPNPLKPTTIGTKEGEPLITDEGKEAVSRFLYLLKSIENKSTISIKNEQNNISKNRNNKSFPIQYINTKNKRYEITGLSTNVLYEIEVATNLDGLKSDYCMSIYVKLKNQNKHIKHVNSLNNLQGEDGDIAFFLDHKKREEEHINKAFNSFEWSDKHPLDYNLLTSFIDSQQNDYAPIYDKFDDAQKYDALAPYGMYYIWKKGRWAEERLKAPDKLALYYEWRGGAIKPIYNPLEKTHYDNLRKYIKKAQDAKKALHSIYALYYHDSEKEWKEAIDSPKLLAAFPPNANQSTSNNTNAKNKEPNESLITPFDNNPSPPITDPNPPKPPSWDFEDDDKNPLKPPHGDVPPSPPSYEWDIGRNLASDNEIDIVKEKQTERKNNIDAIITSITKGEFAENFLKSTKVTKHILNSKDIKVNNLYYPITNFDLLYNEVYKTPNNKPLTATLYFESENKKEDDYYIPLTERLEIKHFLDRAFLFKYNAYDNGLIEYLNRGGLPYTQSITPYYYVKRKLPEIDIDFDKKRDHKIEFTFSTYIKIKEAYGRIELWNINDLCIGYYTKSKTYNVDKKEMIEDKGTLHFASLGNKAKFHGATPATPLRNTKENQKDEAKDEPIYKDFYTHSVPPSSSYIHVMVLVRCTAGVSFQYQGFPKYYAIEQEIYIDYKKVPAHKYVDKKTTHYNYFLKPLSTEHSLILFNTALMPKQPPIYNAKDNHLEIKGNPHLNLNISLEDKSEHDYTHYKIALSHTMLFTKFLSMEERLYLKEFGTHPTSNIPKEEITDDFEHSQENGSSPTKKNRYLGVALQTPKGKNNNSIFATNQNEVICASEGDFFLQHINSEPFKAGVLYRWEMVDNINTWKELLPYWEYPTEYFVAFKEITPIMSLLPKELVKSFFVTNFLINNTFFTNQIIANTGIFKGQIIASSLPNKDPEIKGALYIQRRPANPSNTDSPIIEYICISQGKREAKKKS